MVLEITDLYTGKEYCIRNNEISHNSLKFLDDYNNFKKRLYDYNAVIESLIEKILHMNLFNSNDRNRLLKSHFSNSIGLKDKRKFRGQSEKFSLIKKLLHINLRHLKVMQKLYQENDDIQKFVNESNNYIQEKSFQLNIIETQHENSKSNCFQTRLQIFLDDMDFIPRSIILTHSHIDYPEELILWKFNDILSEQTVENFHNSSHMIKFETNPNTMNHFSKVVQLLIRLYEQIFHSHRRAIALKRLKSFVISIEFDRPSFDPFGIDDILLTHFDMAQKMSISVIQEKIFLPVQIFMTNEQTSLGGKFLDSILCFWPKSLEFDKRPNSCLDNLMFEEKALIFPNKHEKTTIQMHQSGRRMDQRLIFNPLQSISKNLPDIIDLKNLTSIRVNISDSEENSCKPNSQPKKINQLYDDKKKDKNQRSLSNKTRVFYRLHGVYKNYSPKRKSNKNNDKSNFHTRTAKELSKDERIERNPKSFSRRIRVFYRLHVVCKKISPKKSTNKNISYVYSNGDMKRRLQGNSNRVLGNKLHSDSNVELKNKLQTNLNEDESHSNLNIRGDFQSIEKTVSVGIGDMPVFLCDKGSQIDLTELNENCMDSISEPKILKDRIPGIENSKTKKPHSARNFKETLKSFKEFIQSCNDSYKFLPPLKIVEPIEYDGKSKKLESPPNKILKKPEKYKKESFDKYRKIISQPSKLPEMRKNYQVILQKNMPEGIGLEYITPSKSKVGIVISSNENNPRFRRMHLT